MLAKILYVTLATNHVDKYYAFPSHFCLNTCSAGDNYAHARTVNTRLFLSPPTKSLGMRLTKPLNASQDCLKFVEKNKMEIEWKLEKWK